jgi:hypothetical protein
MLVMEVPLNIMQNLIAIAGFMIMKYRILRWEIVFENQTVYLKKIDRKCAMEECSLEDITYKILSIK